MTLSSTWVLRQNNGPKHSSYVPPQSCERRVAVDPKHLIAFVAAKVGTSWPG